MTFSRAAFGAERQGLYLRCVMFPLKTKQRVRGRVFARAVLLATTWLGLSAGVIHAQSARGTSKQARDSTARADSARRSNRAMPGMPGMKGMTSPPAKPRQSKAPSPKTGRAAAPASTKKMSMPMSERPAKGVHSDQRIAVKKESSAMATMPHAKDSAAMRMPGMPAHDSANVGRPGVKDSMSRMSMGRDTAHAMIMKPDSARDTSAMRDMRNMPGTQKSGRDTSMASMPGMAARRDTAMSSMPGMPMRDSMQMGGKSMVPEPLGVSMDRAGSGTTWIPDAVSLPSRHFMAGGWDMMLHGFAFGHLENQSGDRGASQAGSLNWIMFMATHELFGGRVQPRTMLSLDPWTVTPGGYPLLLQSGESFHGEPLHDRQHPHDFWMELGATYERAISKSLGIELYAAPSGEPALGPVAFMHRPSAMDNPTAPLGHHWQDATHVSFGVLTAGFFTHWWKLEGSLFNGREPDENRWDFDPIKLGSYSGRLTVNPTANWSLAASYGYLKSPEALDPTESIHRITASAMYGTPLGTDGQWATTFVYGANKLPSRGTLSNSLLLESEAILDKKNTVFGRAEWVQKSAADLVLDVPPFNFPADREFGVSAATLGYIREVVGFSGATVGLGLSGTLNVVPSALQNVYGSRTPVGGFLFLRLRPTFKRAAMGAMHMDHMGGETGQNRGTP